MFIPPNATPAQTAATINGQLGPENFRGGGSSGAGGSSIPQSLLGTTTLGYAQATTDQATITTVVDVTSCTSTVTVPSGGRRVRITGYVPAVVGTEIDKATWTLNIQESTTVLNKATYHSTTGGTVNNSMTALWIGTPTAGAHTYKLTIAASAGTGSIDNDATFPSFILVELI